MRQIVYREVFGNKIVKDSKKLISILVYNLVKQSSMIAVRKIQSEINRVKAELEQLQGSSHFSTAEIEERKPILIQQIESLQKKIEQNLKKGESFQ